VPAEQILYVETDPRWADTAVFVEHYGRDLLERSANCVVVAGKRGGESSLAACVVLSTTRVDVNGVVRRQLGARKASFAPMDTATGETGMEYGGITPVGLPAGWPVLVDSAVVDLPYVLVGSGRRRGKLLVPGKAFAELPDAVVLEGLGIA
jgi:prolyl-tRNA editing enzyme YbaK/EbsC (Cys-tRNA(Pro) deacylase)